MQVDTASRPEKDSFGHKAPKLAELLSYDGSGRVLFVGTRTTSWEPHILSYFPDVVRVRFAADFDAAVRPPSRYSLIIWTSPPADRGASLSVAMARLRATLTPTGSLFALIENRLDARAALRNPSRLVRHGTNSIDGLRRALLRGGFERVLEFLPFPNLPDVEEFVNSGSSRLMLPSYASRLEVLLNKWHMLRFVHNGAAFIASGPDGGATAVTREVRKQLRASGIGDRDVELDRFDVRDRGALILFFRSAQRDERFICRVTTDIATDRIVKRNVEWTGRIAEASMVSDRVKACVPVPLAAFPLRESTGYLETCIPGAIAWKVAASDKMEPRLFEGLLDFIFRLAGDTARRVALDAGATKTLLDPPFEQVLDTGLSHPYTRLRELLRSRVIGSQRILVWAHGDFGYGNAIANPEKATLNGVIDWDQAREDLAGIDLLNFLVQRERVRSLASGIDALKDVGSRFLGGGFKACDSRIDYERSFPITPAERREIVGLAALRFAQRYMTYPSLLASARNETRAMVEWACSILE